MDWYTLILNNNAIAIKFLKYRCLSFKKIYFCYFLWKFIQIFAKIFWQNIANFQNILCQKLCMFIIMNLITFIEHFCWFLQKNVYRKFPPTIRPSSCTYSFRWGIHFEPLSCYWFKILRNLRAMHKKRTRFIPQMIEHHQNVCKNL